MKPLTQINKPLYNALRQLGLTDSEAHTYIVALQLGPTSATTIAENLSLARPNVYKVLNVLVRRGFATYSGEGYGRTISVISPSNVLEKIRQKESRVEETKRSFISELPDLVQLYHQGASPSKVKLLSGPKQFLRAFDNILEEAKEEIRFFGSAQDFIGFISWRHERAWIKKRVQKGLKIDTLLLPSKTAFDLQKTDAKDLRETRIIKGAAPFVSSFELYANKVIIWQPKGPLGILIEDQYIVEMLTSIFDLLWNRSKKDGQ